MYWGWLTLIPKDTNAPTVSSYVDWNKKGEFKIDAQHGPVPGVYRAEIRRVARNFEDKTSGAYTMEDAELFPVAGMIEIVAGQENRFDIRVRETAR